MKADRKWMQVFLEWFKNSSGKVVFVGGGVMRLYFLINGYPPASLDTFLFNALFHTGKLGFLRYYAYVLSFF